MRKYLAVPLALFAGLATQQVLDRVGVPWGAGFLAGLVVILVVIFLIAERRAAL